ncbi:MULTISPECIES: hypothetical protein [unclassified Micromonospora]|uniref:hypothetical protein n=1 Tax=unclassified Micromonospora TaxID=2617518 RepID=UPI00331B5879
MPEHPKSLGDRPTNDLAAGHWPGPAEIDAWARRRTRRAGFAVPLAVLLVVAVVWGVTVAAGREGGERPTAARAPASAGGGTAPPAIVVPGDPAQIPPEALLQPDDLGPGYQVHNEDTFEAGTYPTWTFNHGDSCPAYPDLNVTAYQRYRYMRINMVGKDVEHDGGQAVHEEVMRYPGATGTQVLVDVRRVVQACPQITGASEASTEQRPAVAVHRWTLLDDSFAGDESLLLSQEVVAREKATGRQIGDALVTRYAVVRVGDLVAVLQTDDYTVERIRQLAGRAAARLCTAATSQC